MKNFDYKKSLGQNFLIDKNIINKISESINPNKDDLVSWLDKQVRTPDILQHVRKTWLLKLVDNLLSQPNIELSLLVQQKFVLAIKIKEKIEQY